MKKGLSIARQALRTWQGLLTPFGAWWELQGLDVDDLVFNSAENWNSAQPWSSFFGQPLDQIGSFLCSGISLAQVFDELRYLGAVHIFHSGNLYQVASSCAF